MMSDKDAETARKGRFTAMVIAGTGVFWVLATFIGGEMGLSQRVRALFDLMALAGFVWAFVLIYQIWRARQDKQG
jgi:threonine/homoserine/homoserine lactone efflux protein